MVVNEHNKLSNIAQKFKYFRYCWACFRLQYAWNICRWTLKQLIINQTYFLLNFRQQNLMFVTLLFSFIGAL